jgi:hypothetical protein
MTAHRASFWLARNGSGCHHVNVILGPKYRMLAYYHKAFPRAWHAAIDWCLGQGLLLSLLLALGVLVCAVLYSALRFLRHQHSREAALTGIGGALRDFCFASVGASAFVIVGVFLFFLAKDAPDRVRAAETNAADLRTQVKNLQDSLDERARHKKIRTELSALLFQGYQMQAALVPDSPNAPTPDDTANWLDRVHECMMNNGLDDSYFISLLDQRDVNTLVVAVQMSGKLHSKELAVMIAADANLQKIIAQFN